MNKMKCHNVTIYIKYMDNSPFIDALYTNVKINVDVLLYKLI